MPGKANRSGDRSSPPRDRDFIPRVAEAASDAPERHACMMAEYTLNLWLGWGSIGLNNFICICIFTLIQDVNLFSHSRHTFFCSRSFSRVEDWTQLPLWRQNTWNWSQDLVYVLSVIALSTLLTALQCISVVILWPQSLYLSRRKNRHGHYWVCRMWTGRLNTHSTLYAAMKEYPHFVIIKKTMRISWSVQLLHHE